MEPPHDNLFTLLQASRYSTQVADPQHPVTRFLLFPLLFDDKLHLQQLETAFSIFQFDFCNIQKLLLGWFCKQPLKLLLGAIRLDSRAVLKDASATSGATILSGRVLFIVHSRPSS